MGASDAPKLRLGLSKHLACVLGAPPAVDGVSVLTHIALTPPSANEAVMVELGPKRIKSSCNARRSGT